jgi:eukaryotic-like serine/threonine-protein kinase
VQSAGGQRMTQTGLSLGTPSYMSPEQAMGERTIDARSDIYALGAVTYEMLVGEAPFTGATVQAVVAKVLSAEPERLTMVRKTIPPHVEHAVLMALAKLPADRFASAAEFATALSTNSGATYAATSAAPGAGGSSTRAQRLLTAALVVTTATAAVALWGWLKPAPSAEVSRDRIVLSDSLATSTNGTIGRTMDIAPDGSAIVFTHGQGEATQLFLKRRDEVTSTVIPGTSGQPTAPTFSPDGQWLAYAGGRDRKLYTIPRAGGSPTALADSLRAANTSIAWLETDTVLYVHQDNGLRAVSRNGGPSRVILAADSGGRLVRNVSALPGGRSALFMMCEAGCNGSALLAVDLQTSKTTRLAEDALDAWWLPGGVVAYAARDGQVYAAPFDVKTLSFTRTPVAVLTGVRGTPGNADMVVSASGMALYVPGTGMLSGASDAIPVWVSRSGTATPLDTGWRVGTAFENGRTLALSPDGRQLAVMVLRSGVSSDIWVKQLDRAPFTNTRVTFGGGNANPVWSPDGRSLLFTSGSSERRGFVFRKPADGTGVMDTVVRLARGLNEVVVTPDSTTFLVRLVAPGSRDIVQARRGRDTAVPLVASPTYQEIGPALSPDGKWLAYASNESGRYEVYVRPYPDVNAGRWQLSQAGGLTPVWSRNGRELFYLDGAGMLVSVAVLPDATFKLGTQTPLFNTSGYASNAVSLFYDVSPDGQRFLLLRPLVTAATGGKVELVQITNWAAEVRAKLAGAVR